MNFQVVSVFPPREPGKVVARAKVVLTAACYMKAEDYNAETKKSYTRAEGLCSPGFSFQCSVIRDGKGNPMIVGSILPTFDMGRQIAAEALRQLADRDAD